MTKKAIALAVSMASLAAPAFAAPTWVGDLETGDVSQWTDRPDVAPGTTDRLTVVTDPVAQGKYAMKATVKPGDLVSSGNRAEVVLRDPMFHQGDEIWLHWYTMFPQDFQTTDKWVLWTQFHGSGFGFPITFNLHGDELNFRVMAHEYDAQGQWDGGVLWKAPIEKGKWMEFVLHVKFSDSANDGFVELWKDGQQVVPMTRHATLDPGDYAYLKQGIYRNRDITYDMTIFHDGMELSTTRPDEVFARWTGQLAQNDAQKDPVASEQGAATDASLPADGATASASSGGGCSGGDSAAAALLFPFFGLGGLFRRRRS